jgi:hypothetical protein
MNNLSFFKNLASKAASTIKDYAQSLNLTEKQYFKELELNDQQIRDKLTSQYESEVYDGLKHILAVNLLFLYSINLDDNKR